MSEKIAWLSTSLSPVATNRFQGDEKQVMNSRDTKIVHLVTSNYTWDGGSACRETMCCPIMAVVFFFINILIAFAHLSQIILDFNPFTLDCCFPAALTADFSQPSTGSYWIKHENYYVIPLSAKTLHCFSNLGCQKKETQQMRKKNINKD